MTLAAFAPALDAGFVWDDDVYITGNPNLLDGSGLQRIWFHFGSTPQYYPLTFTTLWLEHQVWGEEPIGYHLLNILLHSAGALLIWRLLTRLGVPGAWLAAALFAVHPVFVESVAWASELKNVQSGVLYLLCLLAYFRFDPISGRREPAAVFRWWFYGLALSLFGAALLTKPAAVALPLVILLLVWWRRGRVRAADLAAVAPMLLMSGAMAWVTIAAEKHLSGATGALWQTPFLERALIAGRALWFYVGKLLWPATLVSIYPRWEVDSSASWQYTYLLATGAGLALLWLWRARLGRGPLAAALSFAALAAPTLGLFDVSYHVYSFVADHFQYHAAPALLALLAAGVARLRHAPSSTLRVSVDLLCGVLLLVLSVLTFRHAQVFRSEKARCLDTLSKNPTAWLALNNLGVALVAEGNPREAIPRYEEALRVRPRYAEAHNNLGVALVSLRRFEQATRHYQEALRIWPTYAKAYNNLGVALVSEGRLQEAIEPYQRALRIEPSYAEAHGNLGKVLSSLGRAREALPHLEEAVRLKPRRADARNDFGMALVAVGMLSEATEQYQEALRLEPGHREALANLGRALASQGNVDEAVRVYREIVRSRPGEAEAHNDLGAALASQGRVEEAIGSFREALRLRPGYAQAHRNLGIALASEGKLEEASQELRETLRLEPDDADAHGGLGTALARMGRLDEAIEHFRQALRISPGDESARQNLERALSLARSRPTALPSGGTPRRRSPPPPGRSTSSLSNGLSSGFLFHSRGHAAGIMYAVLTGSSVFGSGGATFLPALPPPGTPSTDLLPARSFRVFSPASRALSPVPRCPEPRARKEPGRLTEQENSS